MVIPVFDMVARIEIGKVVFKNVTSFTIRESISGLSNNATIVMPREYMKLKGKRILDYIKAGDPVRIYAGYDDNLDLEFEGHLLPPSDEAPMVLKCEDQFYPLKRNSWVKSYRSIKLRTLLQEIVTGYKIDCPDLELGRFHIDNTSTYGVLQSIKEDFGLYSRIIKDTLYVGFSFAWNLEKTNRYIYHEQKNVKASNLTWKTEEDFKMRVEVNIGKVRNKKETVKFGSRDRGVTVRVFNFEGMQSNDAEEIAHAIYSRSVYNGFTGSITGFGIPRTHAGDSLVYKSDLQPERNGTYLIDEVEISFNEDSGFSRENHLAYKIS